MPSLHRTQRTYRQKATVTAPSWSTLKPSPKFTDTDEVIMIRLLLAVVLLQVFAATIAAQNAQNAHSDSPMVAAGRAFLATLDPAQKSEAVFPFNSEERFRWFYTPVSRKGLPLKELSATQRNAALSLLRAGLSEKGYSARPKRFASSKTCCANSSRARVPRAIPISTSSPSSESPPRPAPGAGATKAITARRTGRS